MNDVGSPQPSFANPGADGASTLAGEHALLFREVQARAQAVIAEADEGTWPSAALDELTHYLQLEVLQQVVDEEWLLFRAARHSSEELALLRREHLELRLAIDGLVQAGATAGTPSALSPPQLAAITRDLVAQLERHLATEEEMATIGAQAPATTSLGARPHEWYSLTEGPVIDLDLLPGEQGVDAVFDRLLRLERLESVELLCARDPSPLWQRLVATDPGGYGIEYLQHGPSRWRVRITRRAPHWTPHPHA
jgi:uncharacterized protein (DUF2249 family)